MRASSARFLSPGETIQTVFGAQTAAPALGNLAMFFGLLGALIVTAFNRFRIVTVTDQRILVLDAGKWTMKNARAVVCVLPRSTRLGPASGLWHTIEIPEGKIRVHRRSFKHVAEADATAPALTNE